MLFHSCVCRTVFFFYIEKEFWPRLTCDSRYYFKLLKRILRILRISIRLAVKKAICLLRAIEKNGGISQA